MANSARRSSRAVNPVQLLSLFLAFVLVAATGGLLAAGLVMPAVAAVGATTKAGTEVFYDLPEELGSEQLSEQSRIYDADGRRLATFWADNRIVVSLDNISPRMQDAVIAVEDHRFYEHGGVDPEGIMRAAVSNLTGGSMQGGSTLTQQYVKNILIEAGRVAGDDEAIAAATETSVGRKLREAKLAIALERVRTKDEILEGYLNVAQFGPSQYGVEVAAQYFFNKSAADLNISESATLAGITQSPRRFNPVTNPEAVEQRRNTVLALMRNQGRITQDEFERASSFSVESNLNISPTEQGCAAAGSSAYFCNYVTNVILNDPTFGEEMSDRRQLLQRGGLEIHTTLDRGMQRAAHETVMDRVPQGPDGNETGISSAISTVEPGTGHIKAMAQNTTYTATADDRHRSTNINFNVDRLHGGGLGFQTGSTFKIYVLAEWLREGRNLREIVDGSPGQHFPRSDWNFSCAPDVAADYDPRNIEGIGTGRMSVIRATEESVNTAYVDMASQLDMCGISEIAEATGLHLGSGDELRLSPSMVLGANEIAPLTMAASVATFANGGVYCAPVAITRVVDADGDELEIPEADCERAVEENVVNGVNYALQRVVSQGPGGGSFGGTGQSAQLPDGRPVAGKTGTSNDNSNAWFVGYVPQLATAIWVGHYESIESMQNVVLNGEFHQNLYGGRVPAPMWSQYMSRALEGTSPQSFPEPNQRMIEGERVSVPNRIGWSTDSARSSLESEGFRVQIADPVESDQNQGNVAEQQPGPGSRVPPGSSITLVPSSGPAEDDEDEDEDGNDDENGNEDDDGDNGRDDDRADRGSGRSDAEQRWRLFDLDDDDLPFSHRGRGGD